MTLMRTVTTTVTLMRNAGAHSHPRTRATSRPRDIPRALPAYLPHTFPPCSRAKGPRGLNRLIGASLYSEITDHARARGLAGVAVGRRKNKDKESRTRSQGVKDKESRTRSQGVKDKDKDMTDSSVRTAHSTSMTFVRIRSCRPAFPER